MLDNCFYDRLGLHLLFHDVRASRLAKFVIHTSVIHTPAPWTPTSSTPPPASTCIIFITCPPVWWCSKRKTTSKPQASVQIVEYIENANIIIDLWTDIEMKRNFLNYKIKLWSWLCWKMRGNCAFSAASTEGECALDQSEQQFIASSRYNSTNQTFYWNQQVGRH